ncbi:hypothetical protein FE257_010692 [Aspergillus nanangensis]|uniref:Uncharacterized protein n=1 Tax=Aspergillus nanangensis TaxID=2582783 RepID=A0AAD4CI86_ASPNN|nr:hypothetical protein FE257_010692 [Aspergillus nanangensis]
MKATDPWTAIVTGGAGGIGAAVTRKLASRGINVLIADLQDDEGEKLVVELKNEYNVDAAFLHVDVSQEADVIQMVNRAVELWGRLDYAANVAGICKESPKEETSLTTELFDQHFAINQRGVWLCQKYQAAQMLKQEPRKVELVPTPLLPVRPQRGSIVNVASTTAINGMGWPAYAPTKHAVLSITKNGALMYGPKGIRCNSVAPGATLTPMAVANSNPDAVQEESEYTKPIALKSWSMPEEQAAVMSFLLSPESSYITGVNIPVDGGFTSTRSA